MFSSKEDIVKDWLPRYTGTPLKAFGEYILLTNFSSYVREFAKIKNAQILGTHSPMQTATSQDGVTIINFGIGSPNAATICDLLAAISPKALLFLGKCGGIKSKLQVGNFLLPIAAIRGEGTSNNYLPPEVPALPSFQMQKVISHAIVESNQDYFTGTIYTTNRRVWEHDEDFKTYLQQTQCLGIDMETATFFTVSFANHIPHGALLLVTDMPMSPEGIKSKKSDKKVSTTYTTLHVEIGLASLKELKNLGQSLKHLIF